MNYLARVVAMASVSFLSLVSLSSAQNSPASVARFDVASATPSAVYAHAISLLRKESQKLATLRADAEKLGKTHALRPVVHESEVNPREEVADFQFYMWRSYAFDPDGAKQPKGEGPAWTASQITEDLENRFFLVKTASWPIQLAVSDEFNNYIAVCEEIIELRKKRLYAEARAIARRGELEQAYQRLFDAIEAKGLSGPAESVTDVSGAEPSETVGPLVGQILEIQQSIDENLTLLSAIPVAEPIAKKLDVEPAPSGEGFAGLVKTAQSEVERTWAAAANRMVNYFAAVGPSEMFVLGIAGISVILLGLFLLGLVSRSPESQAVEANQPVSEVTVPLPVVNVHEASVAAPQRVSYLIQEVESQDDGHGLIRAVKNRLDSEVWLVGLLESIGQSGLNETDSQTVMEWLAGALDRIRETAMVAETANDPAMLIDLFASMQRDSAAPGGSNGGNEVAMSKAKLLNVMLAGISEERSSQARSSEATEQSQAA